MVSGRIALVLLPLLATSCGSPSSSSSSTGGSGTDASDRPTAPTRARVAPAASATAPLVPIPPRIPGPIPSPDGGGGPGDGSSGSDTGTLGDAAVVVGTWQPLVNGPQFTPDIPLLLTDGTIMVHGLDDASTWWRLTPDAHGSYLNGSWSELPSMPSGYQPIFFASAVLADGRVIVIGGEYNIGATAETTLGAIYDPRANVWTPLSPPPWSAIGDSQSVVLADGTFMIANPETEQGAILDARTLTWTPTGSGKADQNSEEGWTLLPSGKVLTVDVFSPGGSELYDPATGDWTSAGSTGPVLAAASPVYEIGPSMLRPDGSVFAMGGTPHTAVYSAAGTWSAGPDFPNVVDGQLDIADGPAVLLPNGNVLCVASPGAYNMGAYFLVFDGATLSVAAATPNAQEDSSYQLFLFLLPTGQVLAIDGSSDIEVYTPSGSPDPSWAPTITTAPSTVVRGTTYSIQGTQFNGLSQAVAYGDDYQGSTNYPLVRITNDTSGHVAYGITHDHSTMGVATGSLPVSTLFEAPAPMEAGASHLVVVANGIASASVAVTIQ
jgi:hypothetical protein